MGADGFDADKEQIGDFFVQQAFHKILKDLFFPLSQCIIGIFISRLALKRLHDLSGYFTGHWRAAMVNILDSFQKSGRRGLLQQIA